MNRNEEFFELMNELEENTPDLTHSVRKATKRRNRVVFAYRPLAGLAACFALFVLLVNFSAPVAQACANIPFLRELANAVTFSQSLSDAVENDYIQQMDLAQDNNGITAKVEYVIIDRKQVNIFYRLESEEHTYMYTNLKVLNKEGIDEEPCSWTTPINDVPNDQLRLITLDYNQEEVPGALQLMLYVYGKPETTIVIRTPRCWTTMVVFVFALQMAAFSSRTFLIQLDTDFQTPENPCRNSEKCAIRTPLSKKQIV